MKIYRHSPRRLSPSFSESEFFTHSLDYKGECHDLDDKVVTAILVISLYYKVPVIITSSYRTRKDNTALNGAKTSFHLRGQALDFVCPLKYDDLKNQITTRGSLFFLLRLIGINGFGIGKNFFHIDCRFKGSMFDDHKTSPFDLWYY